MSSNAAKSYNNWIGGARELPITCMVNMIRVQIMTQLSNRRAESKRWTTKLCPVMKKKLVDSLKLAKSWDVIVASDTVLELYSSISFYVDIGRQTCSCHEWQLNGFPCCHVVHALRSSGRDVYDFINPFFHVDCFRESYKESVYPVPSSERFDFDGAGSSIIKPPITKKQPGRNKKKRIPSRGENVKQIKCGRCLKYGNHSTTWLKALSYGIVNRNKYALAESPLLTANPYELVPFFDWDVYANNPTPNLEDTAKPRIFSTHAPYATLPPDSIKDSKCRIVCVGILWMNLSLTGISAPNFRPKPVNQFL
ncbi:hypothetical protein ACSBR1_013148 [Camellia fascicularis]